MVQDRAVSSVLYGAGMTTHEWTGCRGVPRRAGYGPWVHARGALCRPGVGGPGVSPECPIPVVGCPITRISDVLACPAAYSRLSARGFNTFWPKVPGSVPFLIVPAKRSPLRGPRRVRGYPDPGRQPGMSGPAGPGRPCPGLPGHREPAAAGEFVASATGCGRPGGRVVVFPGPEGSLRPGSSSPGSRLHGSRRGRGGPRSSSRCP